MTSAALDLDSLLDLTPPSSLPCDGLLDPEDCPGTAVVIAYWNPGCDHVPGESLLCAPHRAELAGSERAGRILACPECRAPVFLLSTGPAW